MHAPEILFDFERESPGYQRGLRQLRLWHERCAERRSMTAEQWERKCNNDATRFIYRHCFVSD